MADLLPEGAAVFGKQLLNYVDDERSSKVVLHFKDGTTAEADILLGCDGIHSVTRKVLLGADHPASRAGFSHFVAYRTMVPIDVGIKALGEKVAKRACNWSSWAAIEGGPRSKVFLDEAEKWLGSGVAERSRSGVLSMRIGVILTMVAS